jgi:hypothetical protein
VIEPDARDGRAPLGALGWSVELVKLSDDPNWPDSMDRFADPELFAD